MIKKVSTRRDFFLKPFQGLQQEKQQGAGTNENSRDLPGPTEAMLTDFSYDGLAMQLMKMGIDPSNLDEAGMRELVLQEMQKEYLQRAK